MPSDWKEKRIGAPERLAKRRWKKVRLLFAILFAWRRFLGAIRKTNGFAASPNNGKRYTIASKNNIWEFEDEKRSKFLFYFLSFIQRRSGGKQRARGDVQMLLKISMDDYFSLFFCSWAQFVFCLRRGLRGPGEIREIVFGVAFGSYEFKTLTSSC